MVRENGQQTDGNIKHPKECHASDVSAIFTLNDVSDRELSRCATKDLPRPTARTVGIYHLNMAMI